MCDNCGVNLVKLTCNECKSVFYCSDECGKIHNCLIDAGITFNNVQTKFWLQIDLKKQNSIYKISREILENIKKYNTRVFLHLVFFLDASYINRVLENVRNDWRTNNLKYEEEESITYSYFHEWMLLDEKKSTDRAKIISLYPEMEIIYSLSQKMFLKDHLISLYSLFKTPLEYDIVVYRGYRPNNQYEASQEVTKYKQNQTYINWNFISTSFDPFVPLRFMEYNLCCLMIITVPKGIPVILITSKIGDESFPTYGYGKQQAELLLPPGLVFKFNGLVKDGIDFEKEDKTIVNVTAGYFSVERMEKPLLY